MCINENPEITIEVSDINPIDQEINTNHYQDTNNSVSFLQEKLNFLAACNCCEKHKILKPKKLVKWVKTPHNKGLDPNTSNTDDSSHPYCTLYCYCDCRHEARTICKSIE
tara:strand:- start:5857 stop:6186 length:330 start_codon:yes stop_codon:yes gene_type:complete